MPSASIWTILVCLWPFLTTVRPDVWLANWSFWRPFLAPNGIAIERIWSKSFIFWPLCDRFACYCGFICHFSLFLRWRRNRSGTWILGEWIFRTRLILTRLRRWTFARTGPVIPTQINKYWIIYTIRFKVYIYALYRWTIWTKKYFPLEILRFLTFFENILLNCAWVLLVGLIGRLVVVVGSSRSSKYPTAIVSAGSSVERTCLFQIPKKVYASTQKLRDLNFRNFINFGISSL